MTKVQNIEKVLFDGDEKQIAALVGSGASYEFIPEIRAMTIRLGSVVEKLSGVHSPPACISIYGNSRTF